VNKMPVAESSENETIQELMDKARNNDNPEVRLQALASLSGQEQPDKTATKLVLETALEDKDSRVREYAVQALASQDGREANEYLREALNDPDAGVRMRAVESVGLEGQGIALLQEALSNPDELVQTIAEERLKQVKQ
jgi:HEAT repeat protein